MSPTGSGPKIMLVASPFIAAAIAAQVWWPEVVRFALGPPVAQRVGGAVWLALGLALWAGGVVTFVREFPKGRLITTGAYALCRHPIYASFSLFILPGLGLLLLSWAFIAAGAVMLAASERYVRDEDAELEKTFGAEYRRYRLDVPPFLPVPVPRRRGPALKT